MGKENYIEFSHVTKIFPGCKALNDVSFSIREGEVHALLGENGAGKSTLLNILHGVFLPTEGEIKIDGVTKRFANANEALRFGIAKVHQEINMVPELTVAQNIMLGMEKTRGGLLNNSYMEKETGELLKRLKMNLSPSDKIRNLSVGQIQLLQIAKAIYSNARVISFDEPTASLSNEETELLFSLIDDLKKNGVTIIYVSHRMDEIFKVADRATVLRDGAYIKTFDVVNLSKEELVKSMVGRDVAMFAKRSRPSRVDKSKVVLEVKNLAINNQFHDISFKLYKGEILGFFGLVGAKRTEVMKAIFGADKLDSGEIYINGTLTNIPSPNAAIAKGLGLIPENRKTEGFIKVMNNSDNIALPTLKRFETNHFTSYKKRLKNCEDIGKIVDLKPRDPEFMTDNLSGGNQQKVVLAKWLSTNVDIMIFDEPTKGVDVGAKAEIYNLMEDLIEQGKSIIMVSSEMTEVMGMSDRMFVMHLGEIAGELQRDEFSEETIAMAALEGKRNG